MEIEGTKAGLILNNFNWTSSMELLAVNKKLKLKCIVITVSLHDVVEHVYYINLIKLYTFICNHHHHRQIFGLCMVVMVVCVCVCVCVGGGGGGGGGGAEKFRSGR